MDNASGSIYKFSLTGFTEATRYIDLDQIVAVGMFVEGEIIGISIDCKQRDAPLVIEILTEPQFSITEAEKVKTAMSLLIEAWQARHVW